jgi:hypothetical protein
MYERIILEQTGEEYRQKNLEEKRKILQLAAGGKYLQ